METSLTKKVKGSTMEQIFNSSEVLSVKYFKALNLELDCYYEPESKYRYRITVRHPEGTDAKNLFQKEIKRIEK